MFFTLLPVDTKPPQARARAFLVRDNWDDWGKYSTLFVLVVFDESGRSHDLGGVKIGQFGMKERQRRPNLPDSFDRLDETFFSLGQDESYYEGLSDAGVSLRDQVLHGLRDLAADPALFERAIGEEVVRISLLRSVSKVSVRGQFRRIARGEPRLTRYQFVFHATKSRGASGPPLELSFDVEPDSRPPTNVHVLIGPNGVGKTFLLRQMARALVEEEVHESGAGRFIPATNTPEADGFFSNLVSLTFSAFDPFDSFRERRDRSVGIRYTYVGLQRPSARKTKVGPEGAPRIGAPKSLRVLTNEFVESVRQCQKSPRNDRWRRALLVLESDPLFREAQVATELTEVRNWERVARARFKEMSSGHKIVLLSITRLVEIVEERTLVLLDEPEAHLHPPLLSAYLRALSDLLVQRNGVAIVATHSPVVLQEVPRSCVWKLRRTGDEVRSERPQMETFGENVGILTTEAFGLEVTDAGFHRVLQEAIDDGADLSAVRQQFGDRLGSEALAIVRARIAERDSRGAS